MLVGLGFFGGLVAYVTPGELLRVLGEVNVWWVLAAFVVRLLSTVFRVYRYDLFFPVAGRFWVACGTFSLARFMNQALPFRTGELLFLGLLKKARLSPTIAETVPVWLVLRMTDVVALAFWFALLVGLSAFGRDYAGVSVAFLLAATASLAVIHYAPAIVPKSLERQRHRWMFGRLFTALEGLRRLHSPREKMGAVAFGLMIWATLIASHVALQTAFSVPLSTWDATVLGVFVLGIALLPINAPLGIGTGDALWAGMFVLFGLPLESAVSFALGIRVVMLSLVLTEGALAAMLLWSLGVQEEETPNRGPTGDRPGSRTG